MSSTWSNTCMLLFIFYSCCYFYLWTWHIHVGHKLLPCLSSPLPRPSSHDAHVRWRTRTSVTKCKQAHAFLLYIVRLDDPQCTSKASLLPCHLPLRRPQLCLHCSRPDVAPSQPLPMECNDPWPRSTPRTLLSAYAPPRLCARSHTYLFVHATYTCSSTGSSSTRRPSRLSSTLMSTCLMHCFRCTHVAAPSEPLTSCSMETLIERSCQVMMRGYVHEGFFEGALHQLEGMKVMGIKPNKVTLMCPVTVCFSSGDLDREQSLHLYEDELDLLMKSLNLGITPY